MLKKMLLYPKHLGRLSRSVKRLEALAIADRRESLLKHEKYQDPLSLIAYGQKIYSQNDEDGIIQEIFNRIGTTNRRFVEFGVGDGLENNTLALLHQGWSGLWIEGNDKHVKSIRQGLAKTIRSEQLSVINEFITRENIDNLIASNIDEREIDLLSIDIDGNDAHVVDTIERVSARVIVIEYNAKFPPPISYCMTYNPEHTWKLDDNFGASLSYFQTLFAKKGYSIVACNLCGVNAFFIRNDLVEGKFQNPFTAEQHYQPARYELALIHSGHPASYEALENNQARIKT